MNMRLLIALGLWLFVTWTARAGDVVGQPIAPWQPGKHRITLIAEGVHTYFDLSRDTFSLAEKTANRVNAAPDWIASARQSSYSGA